MIFFDIFNNIKYSKMSPQKVAQSVENTPNEAEVAGLNPPPPFVRTCKKKKKKNLK